MSKEFKHPMNWFERLVGNRYIDVVLLANNQGRLLRASRPISSDDDLLPSMLQAFEVLAQTLTSEFSVGVAKMIQISTELGHILLFPMVDSTYYVVVMVERTAPLMLIMVELERALSKLKQEDFDPFDEAVLLSDHPSDLDADELIQAVQEWLRHRPLP
jgi:predicted regulator of Ras-like GTPase activity (Roadblock/LC7/MglB family)